MEESILLSIIIPVYNVEEYLNQCLSSVFCQDLEGCEVICVNDGSTDGSAEILEEFRSHHSEKMSVIVQTNKGLSEARNAGIEHARGKYFVLMDSDDYYLPCSIQVMKDLIISNGNVDVIQTDCVITTEGSVLFSYSYDSEPIYLRELINDVANTKMHFFYSGMISFVFLRDFWNSCGLKFYPKLYHEDRMMMYQLCTSNGTLKQIHASPYYVYRINRPLSISTNVSLKNYIDRQYIWREAVCLFFDKRMDSPQFYSHIFEYIWWVLDEGYCKCKSIFRRKYLRPQDYRIMRNGISSIYERKIWILLALSPFFCEKYLHGDCHSYSRKAVNHFFSLFDSLFPKWLIRNM